MTDWNQFLFLFLTLILFKLIHAESYKLRKFHNQSSQLYLIFSFVFDKVFSNSIHQFNSCHFANVEELNDHILNFGVPVLKKFLQSFTGFVLFDTLLKL